MTTLCVKAIGFGYDSKQDKFKIRCGACRESFLKSFVEKQTHAKCDHCHILNDCSQYMGNFGVE